MAPQFIIVTHGSLLYSSALWTAAEDTVLSGAGTTKTLQLLGINDFCKIFKI